MQTPANEALALAATLGRTLVVVPHPDDETLGCGGLLALLARADMPLMLVLVSDGAGSHRHSVSYPPARLRTVRLREMKSALGCLGLESPLVWTMGLADGAVPAPGEPAFDLAVNSLSHEAARFRPDTVLLPWRHDAHPDHRASHAIASAACDRAAPRSRRLEYPVWTPSRAPLESQADGVVWRIAIDTVVQQKCRALEAHRSQLGLLILDDPDGFVLPAKLVARCSFPAETYFESSADIP